MAWRGVRRGVVPCSGEPRRTAFLAPARKSNRQIGIVLAAKLGTLTIRDALAFDLEPEFVHPARNRGDAVTSSRPIFPAGTTDSFATESWGSRPASGPRPVSSRNRISRPPPWPWEEISPIALLALTYSVMPARATTNWWVSRRNDGIAITTSAGMMRGGGGSRIGWRAFQSFAAVGPLVQDHKRLSRATGHIAA
jgi:hypothetical protein